MVKLISYGFEEGQNPMTDLVVLQGEFSLQHSTETEKHLQWLTVLPKKEVKSPRVTCHVHNQQEDFRSSSSFSATDELPDTPPTIFNWCLQP